MASQFNTHVKFCEEKCTNQQCTQYKGAIRRYWLLLDEKLLDENWQIRLAVEWQIPDTKSPRYEISATRKFLIATMHNMTTPWRDLSTMRKFPDPKCHRCENSTKKFLRKVSYQLSQGCKQKPSSSTIFSACTKFLGQKMAAIRSKPFCKLLVFSLPSFQRVVTRRFAFRGHYAGDSRKGLPVDVTKALPTTGRNSGIIEITFLSERQSWPYKIPSPEANPKTKIWIRNDQKKTSERERERERERQRDRDSECVCGRERERWFGGDAKCQYERERERERERVCESFRFFFFLEVETTTSVERDEGRRRRLLYLTPY